MASESLSQRLAGLSGESKQRLLARLMQEKSKIHSVTGTGTEALAWVHDAQLAPDIQPAAPASHNADPQSVLLTGGTGFLGAHLLRDLCERTRARVYCLVRARTAGDAQDRLQANYARYFDRPLDFDRVRPLLGDLTQPELGLAREDYLSIAEEADTIVHNGAHLHHVAPYADLKASNVDSTIAALRLAATAGP